MDYVVIHRLTGDIVFEGSLDDCLDYFMEKPTQYYAIQEKGAE